MYLLDTNIASYIIKGDIPQVSKKLASIDMAQVAVSVITEAELRYGVAKRGYPAGLTKLVDEFLLRVDVLPWSPIVARTYADLRVLWESRGITLAPMDMMIAAHARSIDATLVSRDKAFSMIGDELRVEDWSNLSEN